MIRRRRKSFGTLRRLAIPLDWLGGPTRMMRNGHLVQWLTPTVTFHTCVTLTPSGPHPRILEVVAVDNSIQERRMQQSKRKWRIIQQSINA